MNRALTSLAALCIATALGACEGGSTGTTPVSRCYPKNACGDIVASSALNTAAGDLVAGAKLFTDNCARCHGDDGKGVKESRMIDMRKPSWQARFRDGGLVGVVKAGRPPTMPAFTFDSTQLRDLIAHIRSLETKPAAPAEKGY